METSKPCSCGGSNENCARCYGLGSVRAKNRSAGRFSRGQQKAKKFAGASKTSSPKGAAVPKEPVAKPAKRSANPSRRSRIRIQCPLCQASVRENRVDRHMRNVHQTIVGASKDSAFANVHARVQSKRKVESGGNIKEHRIQNPHSVDTGKAGRHERWKEDLEKSQPLFPKNLDATRLYAHAYREHGKYGSHPSHDGFDDESDS